MTNQFDGRPFSARLHNIRIKNRLRYSDMAARSSDARSSAWFNKLLNWSHPWVNSPPTRDTFSRLADLLETSEEHVREMIAEEWYGVKSSEVSPRVRRLSARIDELSDEDAELLERFLNRFHQEAAA
jgi:hypothetical protein